MLSPKTNPLTYIRQKNCRNVSKPKPFLHKKHAVSLECLLTTHYNKIFVLYHETADNEIRNRRLFLSSSTDNQLIYSALSRPIFVAQSKRFCNTNLPTTSSFCIFKRPRTEHQVRTSDLLVAPDGQVRSCLFAHKKLMQTMCCKQNWYFPPVRGLG